MKKAKNKSVFSNKTAVILVLLVVLLVVFGIVMVYSASYYSAQRNYNNSMFFLTKQIVGFVLGLVALIILSKVNYNKLSKFSIPLFIFSIVLLYIISNNFILWNYM